MCNRLLGRLRCMGLRLLGGDSASSGRISMHAKEPATSAPSPSSSFATARSEVEPFELRVLAAARAIAASGDHRILLPTDTTRPHKTQKQLKIGLFGNLANNAYLFTKCLRRLGYDAELIVELDWFDAFLLNRPFWEDLEIQCASYEEGLAHQSTWKAPDYVHQVAYDPHLQAKYQGRYSAIAEVQQLYREAFGTELAADRALVLAQQMGHWPYLLQMQRYDVIQFSGAAISMAPFCPRPYVVFPTGGDLFISPFEETLFGLLVRAGYRGASSIVFCEVNYPQYLDRFAADRPRRFVPMMVDTDTYCPGEEAEERGRWQAHVGGERFLLNVCRQSWQWKGNDRLIRAFARFQQTPQGQPWRLVLMNWGPDVEKSKQLVGELRLDGKVVWEPLCSKPLLRRRQRAADLVADQFVMPGYGTSVLESMAAGKPIVMNPVDPTATEYLDRPPPFVGAATEDEILEALRVMSDPQAREAQGRDSLAWVRSQHGFERVGPRYVEALWDAYCGGGVHWGSRAAPASDRTARACGRGLGQAFDATVPGPERRETPPLTPSNAPRDAAPPVPSDSLDNDSPAKLWHHLRQLHERLREAIRTQYRRSLPLADELLDRWERARFLGFGPGSSIYDSALVIGDVRVGENTWIGPGCVLDGSGGLEIGSFCSIAAGVHLYSHDTIDWALSGGRAPYRRRPTRLGDACYVGPHAVITAGVRIGNHCLIGALSLVKTDLPDRSVAVGCPARIVGSVEVDPSGEVRIRYFDRERVAKAG